MALSLIDQVRLLVQDNVPGLYFCSQDEIQYFLDRNNQNVNRASLEVARVILLNLSMRSDTTVDVLSIKSSKSAASYEQALQLFLKDASLNPVLTNCAGYAGNISKTDMQANVDNLDNNYIKPSINTLLTTSDLTSYFTA